MIAPIEQLRAYYRSGKPLECELDECPYICLFWPLDQLEQFNAEYEVPAFAPGYFGFATSGGGEMYAMAPSGAIVCLPFVGMEPEAEMELADNWQLFEVQLRSAHWLNV